ncbi:hypothetical protein BDZ97DRAFT_2073300 [Flammula alnicola]|nr:hypothetical protein BDZ97DRAFT_2073300 [Flammula alnicola]
MFLESASEANATYTIVSTPLQLFPPHLAYQLSVAIYIHVGCTAVLIYDVLDNFKNDFKLLFFYRMKLPTVLYFVTRITLLAYTLARAVLLTLPLENCSTYYDALNALLVIYVASTIALFYLRVCALYNMNRLVVISYGILFLAVIAMLLTLPQTFTATHIATTQYCGESVHGPFFGPTNIILMVYDTLVYVAIAYRFFQMFLRDSETTTRAKFSLLAFGTSLPIVSKALVKDSHLYFLVVFITDPFLVTCAYVFEPPLNVMFLVCHLVLVNILSCRVYRNMKMGLGTDVAMPQNGISNHARPVVLISTDIEMTTDPSLRKASGSNTIGSSQNHGTSPGATVLNFVNVSSAYNDDEGNISLADVTKAHLEKV